MFSRGSYFIILTLSEMLNFYHNYERPSFFFSSLLVKIGFHTMNLHYNMNIFLPEY